MPKQKKDSQSKIVHTVLFALNNNSDAAQKKFIAASEKFLAAYPGVKSFLVGARAKDYAGDVNDVTFDVALHAIFKNKADYDTYITSKPHVKFIKKYQSHWKAVRVVDVYVVPAKLS
jgi:hypothetical protein